MLETAEEIEQLQALIDRSHGGATGHLRNIITDDRRLTAADIVALLTGMKVISVATVTAAGEPRISALDGHFLHGSWTFSTDGGAAKAKHLRVRPAVSVAHVDHEELAVFSHGVAEELGKDHPWFDETIEHWTGHYGSSPLSWGDDIRMYRLRPTWVVGYAFQRAELLAARGVDPGRPGQQEP